ncbi:HXXEE domain-containing protein [Nesterenkonia massiliensis]|uniref:HXXEE domain-containing protein n=1 Tax=Nesterenkonia massiliensis TaxID=1232429 RepID=UPI000416A7EB|nr:HXXEE domain-containing protein [Nesterenkonia massiliensis]
MGLQARELLWLALLATVLVHNAEELISDLPGWNQQHQLIPGPLLNDPAAFVVAVAALSVLGVLVTWIAVRQRPEWSTPALATVAVVMLLHALSHLAFSMVSASYMPGMLTAAALALPVSALTLGWLYRGRSRGRHSAGSPQGNTAPSPG